MSAEPIDPGVIELAGRVFDLARAGRADEVVAHVDAGVPVNLTNDKGDTLLILTAYHDHPGTTYWLRARTRVPVAPVPGPPQCSSTSPR